jgi:hypothetical protein
MLQAYIDDSTQSGSVMVLAGYMATADQWRAFSERWRQALEMKPRISVFKMRDIQMKDKVDSERAELHYRIIEEHIGSGFCVAIPLNAFATVSEELHLEKKFRKPFYMAWILLISALRMLHTNYGWQQAVSLTFDEQLGQDTVLEAWDILRTKYNGDTFPIIETPIFRSDDDCPPLQAADLLAWWARKKWTAHNKFGHDSWPFPWVPSPAGPGYAYFEVNEDGIRKHITANISA